MFVLKKHDRKRYKCFKEATLPFSYCFQTLPNVGTGKKGMAFALKGLLMILFQTYS